MVISSRFKSLVVMECLQFFVKFNFPLYENLKREKKVQKIVLRVLCIIGSRFWNTCWLPPYFLPLFLSSWKLNFKQVNYNISTSVASKPVFIPWGLRKLFFFFSPLNQLSSVALSSCFNCPTLCDYDHKPVISKYSSGDFLVQKLSPKTCFCSQSQLSLAHTLNEVVSI